MKTGKRLWHSPLSTLVLSAQQIHVWQADLNRSLAQIERFAQLLSPDEQQRASRFYFERDRNHFIAGRGILRTILSRYLNQPPNQIQFDYSSRGKPALATINPENTLGFNLSHSHGLALYALSPTLKLGIDLEYMRPMPDVQKLAQRFFTSREYAAIQTLSGDQQQIAFFNGWTRKEAYLKATGDGLAGLSEIEVSLIPGESAKLLSIAGDSNAAAHWSVYPLTPAPDYVAAVAIPGQDWQIDCIEFDLD
ncbi:MAG: 4'-phosphopantetheinyl transferase superfamily protein [Coleofasciculus sp. G3-WIS-01]|uniref:4'-phosphopantetheinyl transferase family protein n=1 Tax=Coleofasciculus sp. G3-WIS-01 TaxID=3069528 RepID=UPI003304FC2C